MSILFLLAHNNSLRVDTVEEGVVVHLEKQGPRVLAYSDDWNRSWDQTHLYKALLFLADSLDYSFTYVWSDCSGQYQTFLDSLQNGGPWDAVAVDHPSCYEFGSNVWPALLNFVLSGGKLVISEYDMDGDQIMPYDTLWHQLGAQGPYSDLGAAHNLYLWDTTHPICLYTGPGGPNPLPSYFTGYWDDWLDDGDGFYQFTPPGDTVMLLGGLTQTPQDGQVLIAAVGPIGGWPCQTFLISILLAEWQDGADTDGDGMNDAVELWRNAIWATVEGCEVLLERESPAPKPQALLFDGKNVRWLGKGSVTLKAYEPSGRLGWTKTLNTGEAASLPKGVWFVTGGRTRLKAVVPK